MGDFGTARQNVDTSLTLSPYKDDTDNVLANFSLFTHLADVEKH